MKAIPYERVLFLLHSGILDNTSMEQLNGAQCQELAKALADILENEKEEG